MRSNQGRSTFQGVAAASRFVTNLLPFRQRQGVRSWWFLVNNFEDLGLVGKRFMRGSNPLDRGGMSLVYLTFPTFFLPRDAPAANRRTGNQAARRDAHTSGQVPFNSKGWQLPLHRPPAWHVPDEGRPLPAGILGLVSRWLDIPLPSVQIHSGAFTSRLLSSYHADAMTIGRDIYIKTGKFDLRSASGLALLTHELTHVSQQLPGSGDAVNAPPQQSGTDRPRERAVGPAPCPCAFWAAERTPGARCTGLYLGQPTDRSAGLAHPDSCTGSYASQPTDRSTGLAHRTSWACTYPRGVTSHGSPYRHAYVCRHFTQYGGP